MVDPIALASGIATAKTAFDALRTAIGLVKDTKDLLPKDEKTATITAALATAESSSRMAEAEIAKALGYELCKCQFPPTPMLTVGYFDRPVGGHKASDPVYECPKCGSDNAGPFSYTRTAPEKTSTPDGSASTK